MNIRKLAQQVGLSKSAVSLALRNDPSIPKKTQERVRQAADRHGYKLNAKLSEVMGSLARRQSEVFNAPIALLSSWPVAMAWKSGSSFLQRSYQGASTRAEQLGYSLQEFWLGEPGMTPARMQGILAARGIEGVLVFSYEKVPAEIDLDLSGFSAVVIGRALVRPRIYSVDIDHYHGFFIAWKEVMRRGYRRPALLLSVDLDERTEHSWSAAFRYAVGELKRSDRLPVLLTEKTGPKELRAWMKRHRPDVLLVGDARIIDLFRRSGYSLPGSVPAAVLFQTEDSKGFAGIDGGDEQIGARAIELLADQLRNHCHGLPTTPETVLLDGIWCDGPSLPLRAPEQKENSRSLAAR